MTDSKNIRDGIERIGALVNEIEVIADPAARAAAKNLMQSLMDLHCSAIEKALEIAADAGEPGIEIIERMGRDPLVSSVLVLYGLHPDSIDARVANALERVRPQLRKQGCEVELLACHEGVVRIHMETGPHTCASTLSGLRVTLEGAIYDAAPDLISLAIEGGESKPASGFVALDTLMAQGGERSLLDAALQAEPGSGD